MTPILAIISKLPNDLEDVTHILPFWFTYMYTFAWIVGTAVVLCLLIYLLSRLLRYLQSLPTSEKFSIIQAKERRYTKMELLRDLKIIMNNSINRQEFRSGLHRMSAAMKTYYEILLKKEVEEMTAKEIRTHINERKELGKFFTELTVVQFRKDTPDKEEFIDYYKKAMALVR